MEYSYGKQNWFEYSAFEHNAVRNDVGLFDQTAFAKFIVQGNDAEDVLQNICANDVAVKVGTVVYTAMLNNRAGIEADVTVTRIETDKYLIVTSSSTATRDMTWIKRNIPENAHCFVTDVTSSYAVLGVMGPNSRELLSQVVDVDMSNEGFPYMTAQYMYLGYISIKGFVCWRTGLGIIYPYGICHKCL
jgi:4-methylaminobutanoate oxidase (formaldehyde-forming)